MVKGELSIEIAKLKAELAEARKELRKYKNDAEREGKDLGKKFFAGMGDAAKGQFQNIIGALGLSGGILGAGAAIKSIMGEYGDLADTAAKLGEGVETLQRVKPAADLGGTSVEALADMVLKLEQNLSNVDNAKAVQALERYGLTVEGIMGMPLDQKILAFADAFDQARVDGTGYNDLLELVGKSGSQLIPIFADGREKIEEMFRSANVLASEHVAKLAEMEDKFDEMVMTAKAVIASQVGIVSTELGGAWALVTGNLDEYLLKIGTATQEEARLKKVREQQRQEKAKNTAANREQAEAEAAAKKQEEAKKRVLEVQKQIEKAEQDALPDEEKIELLKTQLQDFFESLPADFVSQYGASIEGMKQLAEEMKEAGRFDLAEGILKDIRELQALMDRIADTQKRMDDQSRKTNEERAKNLEKATALEIDFLPDNRKLDAIKSELRKTFEDAGVAVGDMDALKQKDPSAYNAALQKLKEGAPLAGGGIAQKVGSVADAINIFTGRGANQIGEQQVDLLTQARDLLKDIAKNIPGKNGPQELKVPVFSFP